MWYCRFFPIHLVRFFSLSLSPIKSNIRVCKINNYYIIFFFYYIFQLLSETVLISVFEISTKYLSVGCAFFALISRRLFIMLRKT